MSATLEKTAIEKIITVKVSGKLTRQDYDVFVPEIERSIGEFGKIRILFEMEDFHGWDAGALWEDLKFDLRHFSDIERIAFLGDKAWEKGMSIFCRPFTTAQIKYFDLTQREQAMEWLAS
jgi:hypothetical protein